ncbi:MAG: 50S ribosomal protein L3 [Deltaproteobacteria bacterium]|jgi:large subunit ribosomal protein L3|nr:50S ribosomal protein L3 [Deltaproteobacteria bacterium]
MSAERVYPEGLLGKKLGMAHVFSEDGACVPVTLIQLGPCYILDVRSKERNGYCGVQLGFGPKKSQRVNKAERQHFARAGRGAFYHVNEVRCDASALGWTELGKELKVGDVFSAGEMVDVTGTSIGRGFSGVMRRHGMKGQPATRGTHEDRRNPGSIGCRKTPARVLKGHRMSGQMGNERVTVQNLRVVAVKPDDNILVVKGGIPGAKGGLVVVCKAVKRFGRGAAVVEKAA